MYSVDPSGNIRYYALDGKFENKIDPRNITGPAVVTKAWLKFGVLLLH